jgi:hypothetical protein
MSIEAAPAVIVVPLNVSIVEPFAPMAIVLLKGDCVGSVLELEDIICIEADRAAALLLLTQQYVGAAASVAKNGM